MLMNYLLFRELAYTNNTDHFVCTDRSATGHTLPIMDNTRNTADVSTNIVQYYSFNDHSVYATFEAVFDRPMTSSDILEDVNLFLTSLNSFIWAYG